ncbi:MAG: serine protein kinase [Myxococcota bacterium]
MTSIASFIKGAAKGINERFNKRKSVMSLAEYLALVNDDPLSQLRNSAKYIADVFDHFGSYQVERPSGKVPRFRIMDGELPESISPVWGQEEALEEIYSIISSFVEQGRVNKLILLHGPNGSAKTSIVNAIVSAMEHYSYLPNGALYRFSWVFPKEKFAHPGIGFGEKKLDIKKDENGSYAHLVGEQIASTLASSIADHPLLLIPKEERNNFIDSLSKSIPPGVTIPNILLNGDLNPIDRQVFDALMFQYGGDWLNVIRHIRVERFYISRQYRKGVATVDPQYTVDARAQQITLDKNIQHLPSALGSLSLFALSGPIPDAHRGILEYNDMLKRPPETFKYLLATSETQSVFIDPLIVNLDTVFIATSNEHHLDEFKKSRDFQSFKGRFELIKVPYLRMVSEEKKIYTCGVLNRLRYKHIGPYIAELTSLWAVLTRLIPPNASELDEELRKKARSLTPLEKALLYDKGEVPERFSGQEAKELRAARESLWEEMMVGPIYEGRFGASPREIQNVLYNAAQNPKFDCLTVLAVVEELRELISDRSVYEFLQIEPQGKYFSHGDFVETIQEIYLERVDNDFSSALGLAGREEYLKLFTTYIKHLRAWIKKERIHDEVTGKDIPPDENFMAETEKKITTKEQAADNLRKEIMSTIAAYSLEHKSAPLEYDKIFPDYLKTLEQYYFNEKRTEISRYLALLQKFIRGDTKTMEEKDKARLEETLSALNKRYGYCRLCALEGIDFLIKKRY